MIGSIAAVAAGGIGAAKLAKGTLRKIPISKKIHAKKLTKTAQVAGLNDVNFDSPDYNDVAQPIFSKAELNQMRFKNMFSKTPGSLNQELHQQIKHRKIFGEYEKNITNATKLKNKQLERIMKNKEMQLTEKQKEIDKINEVFNESKTKINEQYNQKVKDLFDTDSKQSKKDDKE